MKKYRTVYAIINNKFEKLYVSHEEKQEYELNPGELFEETLLICYTPGIKYPINHLKKDKTCPYVRIVKSTVLL